MSLNKNVLRIVLSLGVVALLTGAFLAVNHYNDLNRLDEREYERRETAKDFSLPVIGKSRFYASSEKIKLTELRGKPLLLHFWASWCQICRQEKPDIDAFWEKHKDEDIIVLGIASFDTREAMADSKLIEKPSFAVVLDEEGTVADAYKVSALPVSVLVDSEGFIVRTFKGTLKPYDFAAIESYLDELKKAH